MSERNLRIGRVSAINYPHGMISVTYPDLDDAVTDYLPMLAVGDEYKMPGIGEEVLVIHMPNGYAGGIVLGKYWNEDNRPAKSGKDVYRKEFGQKQGEAYLEYSNDRLLIHAKKIIFESDAGKIDISDFINSVKEISDIRKEIEDLQKIITEIKSKL
ncbi:MAG: phage baseplate assembly protein V [Lachnospiraceae bacterium]|nr:phage baseplate assembly protein V [Lachnospiraceae bacterium]